jgi:3-deoxy-D-manno-octulosonate 8-phosphate phosphatase (KDO 8-P phosphatase)
MSLLRLFKPVTTFVFDLDGVLTDGSLFVFENGEQVRQMNIKDGYALQLALKKGYRVAILSGGNAEGARLRLNRLGIRDVFLQVENKKEKLEGYIMEHHLQWKEILFMGDDIPDYPLMVAAGLPCAPADAVSEIKQLAKYVSSYNGGKGCVRDVIEKVLKLNDHWDQDTGIASK